MGQSSTNVFERISAEYYNLTPAEKKAADYVLSHQRKTQDMSITELAAASGVAEATVSRFCRRLGCKGSTFKGPFHLPRMLVMTDLMAGELLAE